MTPQPKEPEQEPLEYWNAVEGWVKIDEVREHFNSVGCGTIYKTAGEGRVPLSLCKAQSAVAEQHKQEPCPDKERDEYACKNRHQCWEPCGELGKSEKHAQPKELEQQPVAWPCVIETADFEEDTVTLKIQTTDYSVGVGLHWLSNTPPQRKTLTDWIDPNDKTQERFLPNIGEPVLFCHEGKTYYGKHNGGSFQYGYGVTKRHYNTWECRWMYLPAAHGIKE